jgi:hypothetical protein
MSEHFANLNLPDGEKLPITDRNIILYRHLGAAAVYDHLFVTVDGERGLFIWAQQPPDNPNYLALAPLAVKNEAELHINIHEPAQGDIDTFNRHALEDLDQEFPDWMPEVG